MPDNQHPAGSPATAFNVRTAREGHVMHLIPSAFATSTERLRAGETVRTACGRAIVPGSVWVPTAWDARVDGRCTRCATASALDT